MTLPDTLKVIQHAVINPVTVVNVTVLFGMTEAEWDLLLKVLVGFASFVFTCAKIYLEIKKSKKENDI